MVQLNGSASSTALTDQVKKRLKATVLDLRRLLEDDLAKGLRRLGIDPAKPTATPIASLSYLTQEEREARLALDAVLAKEQAMAGKFSAAVEALRREAAYTHLNRLVGLKCLELRGHLRIEGETTETVTCRPEYGGRPKWLWTLRDRESKYRYGEDAEELLWRQGIRSACAAVTREIGVLFDPADPYAQVWPSHRALREAVDRLNDLSEESFRADELLGWVYQYFQSAEKDRVFEQVRTQKKKIAWQDIVPVTQLYTERYMVDFLLQNSLGARWMEMYGGLYEDSGAGMKDLGEGESGGVPGSGGVAEGDGSGGGGLPGDEDSGARMKDLGEGESGGVQGSGGVAEGDGSGGGGVRGDQGVSEGGDLRAGEPDAAGGGVDPLQHRGRARPQADASLPASPGDSQRLAGGTGDPDRDSGSPGLSHAAAIPPGAGQRSGQDAGRTSPEPPIQTPRPLMFR